MSTGAADSRLERALASGSLADLVWALDLARREKGRAESDFEFRRWAEAEAELKRRLLDA